MSGTGSWWGQFVQNFNLFSSFFVFTILIASILFQALPVDDLIYAGHVPPDEIIAVIRPASYVPSSVSRCLDQKSIIKNNLEMYLEVKFTAEGEDLSHCDHIYSTRIQSSSRNGVNGLYIFTLGRKFPKLLQKAGVYIFSFFIVSVCVCVFVYLLIFI